MTIQSLRIRLSLVAVAATLFLAGHSHAAPPPQMNFPGMDPAALKEWELYVKAVKKVRESNPKAEDILSKIDALNEEFAAEARAHQAKLAALQDEADTIILPDIVKVDPTLSAAVARKEALIAEMKKDRARQAAEQAAMDSALKKYLAERPSLTTDPTVLPDPAKSASISPITFKLPSPQKTAPAPDKK